VVPLEGATLADCAHTYFRQSEQLPTGIKIARGARARTARTLARSALMVQQMPEFDAGRIDVDREQREDDWRKAVILMASATEAEMLDPKLPAMTLLHRLFHAEQARLFARRPSSRAAAAAASASTACCARSSARSSTTCATRRPRRGEVRVLLDRVHLRRRRPRPDLRLGGVNGSRGICAFPAFCATPSARRDGRWPWPNRRVSVLPWSGDATCIGMRAC
jgi:beta-phosphoglucomutase-like phosphatase (HAD superfamily)